MGEICGRLGHAAMMAAHDRIGVDRSDRSTCRTGVPQVVCARLPSRDVGIGDSAGEDDRGVVSARAQPNYLLSERYRRTYRSACSRSDAEASLFYKIAHRSL